MSVWLFQALLKGDRAYDLTKEVPRWIKTNKLDRWLVNKYRDEMHSGDVVLLWQSGDDAGIYATGELVGEPKKTADGLRVKVRYNPLLKEPIYKRALRNHPVLANLLVIRQPQGTNFKVEPEEWRAIQRLMHGSPQIDLRKAEETILAEGIFDPKNDEDARERISRSIVLRRGQRKFREKLLAIYQGRCLISGCDAVDVLEAAHIQPYKGTHTDQLSNGLLLRADLHTLFDLRLLAVDPDDMTVLLSPALQNSCYGEFHRQPLVFPGGIRHRPSKEALKAHREKANW